MPPRFPETRPPVDRPSLIDLDVRWRGVNERDEPGSLEGGNSPAYACAAVNYTFSDGQPQTRGGFIKPVSWNPSLIQAYSAFWTGKMLGAGVYVDTSQREWILLARHHSGLNPYYRIWQVRDGEYPQYTTPQWTTDSFASTYKPETQGVRFLQAGAEMILWRRGGLEPLHWDGDSASEWEPSSTATVTADTSVMLQPLPAAELGITMSGRVVFPINAGEIGFTDILEPRRWDSVLSRFRVGGETGGAITGLAAWRNTILVIFKENRVYAVRDFTGDLSSAVLTLVSDQAGCIAHDTITTVGGDLIFLGNGQVYRLTEVLQDSAQLSPTPVSWRIPATMRRINWKAARGQATAVLADGLWLLCVPVDGSLINNAVFVLDTRTMEWQGEWELNAYSLPDIHAAVRANLFGRETAVLVTYDHILGQGTGCHDGLGTGDIPTFFESRGYAMDDIGMKRLRGILIDTEEHGTAGVALKAMADGQTTEQTLTTAQTRNRAKYLTFGQADRDLSNPDNNAQEPNREDYAWTVGDDVVLGSNGVQLGVLQHHRLKGQCSNTTRWIKARLYTTRGHIRITAVRAEGFAKAE